MLSLKKWSKSMSKNITSTPSSDGVYFFFSQPLNIGRSNLQWENKTVFGRSPLIYCEVIKAKILFSFPNVYCQILTEYNYIIHAFFLILGVMYTNTET